LFWKKNINKKTNEEEINEEIHRNNCCILQDCNFHYTEIMRSTDSLLKKMSKEEQLIYLDYLIRVMLIDVCSGSVMLPMMNGGNISPINSLLPYSYYDEKGNNFDIRTNEKHIVSLADDMVYVSVWSDEKISKSVLNLFSKKFVFDDNNHKSIFFTDIDLCYVYEGNHSINAGRYYKNGEIVSDVCNTELLYPHWLTDGLYWYNRHDGKKNYKVSDFRLAAVYSLAQMRYYLRNNVDLDALRLDVRNLYISSVYNGDISKERAMNRLNIELQEFERLFDEYKKSL